MISITPNVATTARGEEYLRKQRRLFGIRNYSDIFGATFTWFTSENDSKSDFSFWQFSFCEMKFSWTNHTVTNIQEVNPDTLRECVFSSKPVMQQSVCSSTHHTLSRLYPEPQLILMLSMQCCWWKIKHCWSPLCILPQHHERPLRGSRMTRQPCCLFTAFPKCILIFTLH